MEPQPLNHTELAKRQAIQILQQTIKDLCLRRDALVATLEETVPRQKMPTHICGIKLNPRPTVTRK